jgi:hypothetical protein
MTQPSAPLSTDLPPISRPPGDALPWLPMSADLPGLAIKYLHINAAEDTLTALLKMPAGGTLPRHRPRRRRVRAHAAGRMALPRIRLDRARRLDGARTGRVGPYAGNARRARRRRDHANVMRGDLVLLDDDGRETARENCRVALLRQRKHARTAPHDATAFVTR